MKYAVYITSDDRSGSTMLDLLLANHPDIFCIGEVHNLAAYTSGNRSFYNPVHDLVCMCGTPVMQCYFWQTVEKKLGKPLNSLRLRSEKYYSNSIGQLFNQIHCRIEKEILMRTPRLQKYMAMQFVLGHNRFANDTFRLYEAVSDASGSAIVTDSSKWPFRFRYLYDRYPDKVRVIKLFRSPLAVISSKIRRGEVSARVGAKHWAKMTDDIALYCNDIPESRQLQIYYEDLCRDAKSVVRQICRFLDISEHFPTDSLKKQGMHHIGGSPSKFVRESTNIALDTRYKNDLTEDQVQEICSILGRFRQIYPELGDV